MERYYCHEFTKLQPLSFSQKLLLIEHLSILHTTCILYKTPLRITKLLSRFIDYLKLVSLPITVFSYIKGVVSETFYTSLVTRLRDFLDQHSNRVNCILDLLYCKISLQYHLPIFILFFIIQNDHNIAVKKPLNVNKYFF